MSENFCIMEITEHGKPVLPRVLERPSIDQWREDELLSLPEAVALFWPKGPLSVSSLRHQIKTGALSVAVIGRKHLVTPRALRSLAVCRPLAKPSEATSAGDDDS